MRGIARLWRVSRFDFNVAMVAFAGVLVLGILKGVLLAAVVSILMLLRRAAYPNVAFLGRIPQTRRFSDLARHPDNERIDGVLVFRVESSILYFNAENVLRTVLDRLHDEPTTVRRVVCDLSAAPYVDISGARMLAQLATAQTGGRVPTGRTHATTRDLLRAGAGRRIDGINRFTSVADAVEQRQPGPL
jgi:MFS superfamily sulfate permease-like transporter